jgi:glutamate racemase
VNGPPNERPIGVFDSGLGGLTVLRALIDLLPNERTIYFGDTGHFPYGAKPLEDVLKYSLGITELLLERDVKAIVIACNNAAAAALETLDERLDIPVVGVIEPGLRAGTKATRSGRLGVIATAGTVASGAYQKLSERIAPEIDLYCAGCPGFVEFVEAGDVDSDEVHVLAERLLAPLREADVDTLVLGCTHYPLLARTIGDVMGPDVVLVSSADETAFAVRELLIDGGLDAAADVEAAGTGETGVSATEHRFITSGSVTMFRELGSRFLGPEVETVEAWQWS